MPRVTWAYAVAPGTFDEAVGPDGPRPHARAPVDAVMRAGPRRLERAVAGALTRAGVGFRSVEGDASFHVDPVPRVITAAEWAPVKRGLAQRVRALNRFVADVYGARAIVAAGVVPERVI